MNILVCIKQVPSSNNVEVDPETGVLKREGASAKLNPYDLFAVETALELAERFGGRVTTLTMGPDQAKQALMETLAMGADEAYLLSDRRFAGADVLATSHTLAEGIRMAGAFDLILTGKQTTDGDTAQVGPEIAEHLGIPHATNVEAILELEEDAITVRLQFESFLQTQRMKLPALLAVDKDINTPRLPSYLRRKAFDPASLHVLSLDDFHNREENRYGLSGSPTQVERIFPPASDVDQTVYEGTADELADRLYDILRTQKFI